MTLKSVQRGAPAMTRCHFAFIASVIASLSDDRQSVAHAFAARLAATNPRFDRERFLAACGVKS
jgi:hypothetical protein